MRLNLLYENDSPDAIKNAMGLKYFKRDIDPMRHLARRIYPIRSGNQDTPLKPRHRIYFNAPIGATQGKIGRGVPLGGEVAGGEAGARRRRGPRKSGFLQKKGKYLRPD